MKVNFYGTRGSIPVAHPEYQEFGGNTTCLQITLPDGRIGILDAGTGIRQLGKDLLASDHQQFDNIYVGFTHFHWDHIQGFPFFAPAYDPRRHFTISAMGHDRMDMDLRGVFEAQMQAEFFPVPLEKMGARFSFFQSTDDHLMRQGTLVRVMPHRHPGVAYSYRIEDTESDTSIVFATDIEHGETLDPSLVEFARGADLLIHDGQYTPEELPEKTGWGHSSWEQAIQVAEQADVKQLAITHHDPDHDDLFLKQVEKDCQARYQDCFLAREGVEITV